uniref:Large ribosomal subunit protein bL35c n=1 Tax=Melanothamnus harveyi TaxID=397005 RepID=A0A1Z1MHA5_MELHR|nr:ribosomal protein L35 [Melanothamnus harveyi]ARW65450.1 ribosomal protein L35 [Melanothamnus harveyi]
MYKLKTNKSINKRFKLTSSSKLLKHSAGKSHLLQKKSANRKRKLRRVKLVNSSDQFNFIKVLPYLK